MHTIVERTSGAGASSRQAPPRQRPRASPSPARPATPARNCCACWRAIPASRSRRRCRRAPAARRGGCRRWRGSGTARSRRSTPTTLARDADVVFLALPDAAAAELAPALVDAGVRVIDLSGAFRLRDAAARARWYPETHRLPAGVAYGLTERERGAVARARLVANPGCYPTATLLALAPLRRRRPAAAGRRHHRRRQVGRLGRRQDAVRAHAFLRVPRQPVGLRRVQPPPRRRDRAGRRARPSRSRRTWCRSIAAFWRRSTCACAPGTTEDALGGRLRARVRGARRSCG